MYGTLGHYPAGKHPNGTKRQIYDWDSGAYLGEIDEAPETYNVIGNLNEHGVAIGESTFGGNETLANGPGVLDYGSLIWVTLQRSKTARQAVEMFGELVKEYGYVSEGESFTIADFHEVWVLEMIGKGKYEKGAVWVAVRIPDGHVSGHANQARIQQFPLDDPDSCVYSSDVIDFAVKIGLWDSARPKSEFSFSDIFDPITFGGARQAEARVWRFLAAVAKDGHFGEEHEDYALGKAIDAKARMPLSIEPRGKISALDLMGHMRDHYEGTALDSRQDVGAGASGSPFRARPIQWTYENRTYVNERFVGTPQAGWNFVAQLRGNLPPAIGGRIWFGVDDATFSVHAPIHGGMTRVPKSLADGTGDALTYSTESAFWAFNTVANFIYPRWFLAAEVVTQAQKDEASIHDEVEAEERAAIRIYHSQGPEAAVEYMARLDEARANKITQAEFALFGKLMTQNRDGFKISSQGADAPDHGGAQGGVVPKVEESGYTQGWYKRIVQDAGDRYRVPDAHPHYHADAEIWKLRALNKGVTPSVGAASPQISDEPVIV